MTDPVERFRHRVVAVLENELRHAEDRPEMKHSDAPWAFAKAIRCVMGLRAEPAYGDTRPGW